MFNRYIKTFQSLTSSIYSSGSKEIELVAHDVATCENESTTVLSISFVCESQFSYV